MTNRYACFSDFEDIRNDLGNKKISDLSLRDIAKYLLVAEELDWMVNNIGDDKEFYTYDEQLLDDLSYNLEDKIFETINENLLYNNDLHTAPELDEMDLD